MDFLDSRSVDVARNGKYLWGKSDFNLRRAAWITLIGGLGFGMGIDIDHPLGYTLGISWRFLHPPLFIFAILFIVYCCTQLRRLVSRKVLD